MPLNYARAGGNTSSVTALAGDAPRHLPLEGKAWGWGLLWAQRGRRDGLATQKHPLSGVLLYVVFAVARIYDCAKYALAIRWYWYIALHSLARFSLLLFCLLYR